MPSGRPAITPMRSRPLPLLCLAVASSALAHGVAVSPLAPPPPPPPPPLVDAPAREGEAEPPPPAVSNASPSPEDRLRPADAPVRAHRRIGFAVELGWNSLSGVGLNAMVNVLTHLAIDGGAGLSFSGWKFGLRARWNFLESELTPFLGGGVLLPLGTGGKSATINTGTDAYSFRVDPTPIAQFVCGLDYTGEGGFTFVLTAGYAVPLSPPVVITQGRPDASQMEALGIVFGGGIVLGLAFGYTF